MLRKGYACLLTLLFVLAANFVKAQLNPFQSAYFQNRYLNDPAMAGLDKGLNLNLDYLQQLSSFPGSPKTQALTVEYQASAKVGLGLNINDEQEGLFRETRVMATYAYHLPLGEQNQKLNFGLSLGINDSHINYDAINGDITDPDLLQYNQIKPNFDGDLGLSYTSDHLFIEAALPNLNANIFNRAGQNNNLDRSVFLAAISYKINLSPETSAFSLEPLAAYRGIKGFSNIFDAGLNFKMSDYHLDAEAVYHSNNNVGFGLEFAQKTFAINFAYDLATGQIGSYTNGGFELGIKLKLFNK